jgi:SAM-dependent methyltransferase
MEAYFRHGTSLALYRDIPEHQQYWDEHWNAASLIAVLQRASTGDLDEFEYPFGKYLPRQGLVLEAGCGTGYYVGALQKRGYQVEGIDYAAETIQGILALDPSLPVRVGNIYAIDCPDCYYAAYISIGVLEHNYAGPEAGLREAYRVLQHGGVALITVPYLNWPRRNVWRKAIEAQSRELAEGLRFYQDHLDVSVFSDQLNAAGFKILERYPYALYSGLIRDWLLFRWLRQKGFFPWRLHKIIKRLCLNAPDFMRRELSHMMLFACQKV